MKTCEPRQDRKVAAVSKNLHVPQGHLVGAGCLAGTWEAGSRQGARPLSMPRLGDRATETRTRMGEDKNDREIVKGVLEEY